MFLDSGAFTLNDLHKGEGPAAYAWFESAEFYEYADRYATFVKENTEHLDLYANLDVMHHPELSWKMQQYLEKEHGLSPVPVVHSLTPLKWVSHYMDRGYDLIGVGGVAKLGYQRKYFRWLDSVFAHIGDSDGVPRIRTHGFGVANFKSMTRYPWWSIDASKWVKLAAYGIILVPKKRNGVFDFTIPHVYMSVSNDRKKGNPLCIGDLTPNARKWLDEWLSVCGVSAENLQKHFRYRAIANVVFFEHLRKSLPEWPWPFKYAVNRKGFFDDHILQRKRIGVGSRGRGG